MCQCLFIRFNSNGGRLYTVQVVSDINGGLSGSITTPFGVITASIIDNGIGEWELTIQAEWLDQYIVTAPIDGDCPLVPFESNEEYQNLTVSECVSPIQHTNILASGVSNVPHIAAFDAMVEQRFANLDIEAVLIYLIDTVNVSALPSLAAQFDVLGYKGYGLAQTEQQRREVIKRAIELHRYKGTPWSIKEALKAIGYYDAIIDERLVNPIYYDGTYNHNGSQIYGPGHWAEFRVKIDLGNDMGVTAETAADAVALIHEYKNVRSKLRDVSYIATLNDYVTDIQEELTVNIEYTMNDALGYYHDNTYLYGGAITHGTITETITQTTN
jgi:P2-related tail formation protein